MFEAACLVAEIDGAISDKLAEKRGYSYLASEIAQEPSFSPSLADQNKNLPDI